MRNVQQADGKPETKNIRIDVIVAGVTDGSPWECGLEFDYANQESFYCRPLRLSEEKNSQRMAVPKQAEQTHIAFLPPMSGLAANETRLDIGAINVRLGEGRTADVLRNLCYLIRTQSGDEGKEKWMHLTARIKELFGVNLEAPIYIAERGEIEMAYRDDQSGARLDLSSAGRGLQQTLLLLAHLSVNEGSVLLLDEPDAHLEILRQRQIYQLLVDTAREQKSQVIIASHSEVVLEEAADRDVVVAFLGKPHRIDDRGSQLLKSLKEIGFDQYYQSEQTGWVLYLEGSTDLAMLRAFAKSLNHPAFQLLERPFVHYVMNQPSKAKAHFYGLREANPSLVGFALFDHGTLSLPSNVELAEYEWSRREIENYLCSPAILYAYAEAFAAEQAGGPLFEAAQRDKYRRIMNECIEDFVPRIALNNPNDQWWIDVKASNEFLDRLFAEFFKKLDLPNLMQKTNYHVLARNVPSNVIDPEVARVLDQIVAVAKRAKPDQ